MNDPVYPITKEGHLRGFAEMADRPRLDEELNNLPMIRVVGCVHKRVRPPGAAWDPQAVHWSLPMLECPDCGQNWFFLRRRP